MTTEIKELSEKLAGLYGVDVKGYRVKTIGKEVVNGADFFFKNQIIYLAEDSGRIGDLADDNDVTILMWGKHIIEAKHRKLTGGNIIEIRADHPTKHDAARMARVRCLIAIGANHDTK